MNIKNLMHDWSKINFEEADLGELELTRDLSQRVTKEFDELGISNARMDGYCTEKLPKTSETGRGQNYSNIFHELLNSKNFSPSLFLAKYIKDYLANKLDPKRLNGFLARGLRTFASLLREQDFANKIKNNLIKIDQNTRIKMDPEQDTKSHVDIKLFFKGNDFNIWTYQASKNAIYPHTIERVTGQRGELEKGIHVLCPISTEQGQKLLIKRKSFKTQNDRLNKWYKDLKNKKTKKQISDLQEKMKRKKNLIKEIGNEIKKLENETANIDIVDGWFLYSNNYVDEISSMIGEFKKQKIFKYSDLSKTLLMPEKILRSVTFFEK